MRVGRVAAYPHDSRGRKSYCGLAGDDLEAVVVVVAAEGAGQSLEHAQGLEVRGVEADDPRTHGHHLQLVHLRAVVAADGALGGMVLVGGTGVSLARVDFFFLFPFRL